VKQSIAKHKEIYSIQESYVALLKAEIDSKQAEYDKHITALDLHNAQIELAEKKGKKQFDADHYAIRRLCT